MLQGTSARIKPPAAPAQSADEVEEIKAPMCEASPAAETEAAPVPNDVEAAPPPPAKKRVRMSTDGNTDGDSPERRQHRGIAGSPSRLYESMSVRFGKTRRLGSNLLTAAPLKCVELSLSLSTQLRPATLGFTFDVEGGCLLKWDVDVCDASGESVLPRGSCNIYIFPLVMTAVEPKPYRPSDQAVELLCAMIRMLADDDSKILEVCDPVGAYPIHALMVRRRRHQPHAARVTSCMHPSMQAASRPTSPRRRVHGTLALRRCALAYFGRCATRRSRSRSRWSCSRRGLAGCCSRTTQRVRGVGSHATPPCHPTMPPHHPTPPSHPTMPPHGTAH
jgi:hypothetical protein